MVRPARFPFARAVTFVVGGMVLFAACSTKAAPADEPRPAPPDVTTTVNPTGTDTTAVPVPATATTVPPKPAAPPATPPTTTAPAGVRELLDTFPLAASVAGTVKLAATRAVFFSVDVADAAAEQRARLGAAAVTLRYDRQDGDGWLFVAHLAGGDVSGSLRACTAQAGASLCAMDGAPKGAVSVLLLAAV